MRISVFGIGYVGVVSCGCLAELGHEVIGVDIAPEKLAMLASGRSPIVEEFIDTLIAGAVQQGRLTATQDVVDAVNRSEIRLSPSARRRPPMAAWLGRGRCGGDVDRPCHPR